MQVNILFLIISLSFISVLIGMFCAKQKALNEAKWYIDRQDERLKNVQHDYDTVSAKYNMLVHDSNNRDERDRNTMNFLYSVLDDVEHALCEANGINIDEGVDATKLADEVRKISEQNAVLRGIVNGSIAKIPPERAMRYIDDLRQLQKQSNLALSLGIMDAVSASIHMYEQMVGEE